MSEPRRLLQEEGDELGQSLLRSARRDGPSPQARRKAMLALGVASGVGASVVATGTGAASTLAKSTATAALLKWIGVGVVGGLVTVGAVSVTMGPPAARTTAPAETATMVAVPARSPIPSAAAPAEPPAARPAETAAPPEEAPAARPVETAKAVARSADKPTLGDEIAALDAAREALGAGNAAAALRALDDHDRRFPGGMLGPEATVLRIEALALRGDRASATRLGRAFLDAHPRSPAAARIRTLLGIAAEPAPAP
jgi:hypothetical protein